VRNTILEKLTKIEEKFGVTILYAAESGSRAWGFPSPDSDYDVRFIYVRPIHYYLSVMERADTLAVPISEELDIYGWDLRKILQLLRKSNTTAFEWLQSPIVYREVPNFKADLWALCPQYFDAKANLHHYLGIAKTAFSTMENDNQIKIKKLFYVLRPLLCAKWIIEKNEIAPMNIEPLLTLLPSEILVKVENLIKIKENAVEAQLITLDLDIKTYIDFEFENCQNIISSLPKSNFEIDALDDFFLKILA
jgi:uncharacterized protein